MTETNFKMVEFNKEVLQERATWWQMELPSGDVIFGDVKTKMLGYPQSDFTKYTDFTDLLHPEDYEKTMKAMKDHLEGKNKVYEAVYRIKAKNGKYISFYDCGQIIKKHKEKITVIGFVMKVDQKKDIFKQMEFFKSLIIEGKPSILELVAKMK